MKSVKNISLIYEYDRATLERAATLAKERGVRLTIVYPTKDVPERYARLTVGGKSLNVRDLALQEQEARLKEAAKAARKLGIRPQARLVVGEPFVEIIRDVIEHRRDLVIMTAEGRAGVKERLFGSLSRHLMRKCPAPLLVMKPGRQKRFHRVLAAVDPEISGDTRDTLNGVILELASWLAARDDAQLHVAHAWTLFGEYMYRSRGSVPTADVDRMVRDEAARRRHEVEVLLEEHVTTGYRVHLPKGDPALVIPDLVRSQDIDLLVMGTVCRTGIPGFIIGNTAEKVLDTVDCSVLTVKPVGFVSPIAPQIAA
jgi:nucleotide-binding universal stress UspA family protein